ncbi:MAG: hypothetical protein Q8N36_05850 [bacterium]|nr:hypothetical protein [bacterium]
MRGDLNMVRLTLLALVKAFSGSRGKTGVLGFLTGEASRSTLELARSLGISSLHGALGQEKYQELSEYLSNLIVEELVEVKEVKIGDNRYPLLFITAGGENEINRLKFMGFKMPATTSDKSFTPKKVLLVLGQICKLAALLEDESQTVEQISAGLKLTLVSLQSFTNVLAKVVGVPEGGIDTFPGRKRLGSLIERALRHDVFGMLPEIEAQCLRLSVNFLAPHQMAKEEIESYYHISSFELIANEACERLLSQEMQRKSKIASAIAFLSMSFAD